MTDTEEKPLILGADGNPIQTAEAKPQTAVIFAKLCEHHPANKGLEVDGEIADPTLKVQGLVAVELPPNCVIADAMVMQNEGPALVQLAHRCVAIIKGKGAVRVPVPEQRHMAQALVILLNRLNQARMDRMQAAAEFRMLFEAHGKYQAQITAEAAEREAAFTECVCQAYLDGIADECDVYGQIGDDDLQAGLAAAADRYMERFKKDPPAETVTEAPVPANDEQPATEG